MIIPAINRILMQIGYVMIGVLIICLFSKALRLQSEPLLIKNPKKEVSMVFPVYFGVFLVVTVWHFIRNTIIMPQFPPFELITVLLFLFLYILILLPMIIGMNLSKQSPRSIGIDRDDLARMIALGAVLSIIYTIISSVGHRFQGVSPSLAYALIAYIINSFSEEILFRGYMQTRLITYWGSLKGLLVTSLLFALWHFPGRYFEFSGDILTALDYSMLRFTPSILLGYLMVKSQNIIPSAIFHVFWNWNILLWGL
jgi:membrane protease YdiL (CAAX protease family)